MCCSAASAVSASGWAEADAANGCLSLSLMIHPLDGYDASGWLKNIRIEARPVSHSLNKVAAET
jgi:hypothetical protein